MSNFISNFIASPNVDCAGTELSYSSLSLEKCAQDCFNDSKCGGFVHTLYNKTNWCYRREFPYDTVNFPVTSSTPNCVDPKTYSSDSNTNGNTITWYTRKPPPMTYLDYIFQYSYLISFLSAIFYSISSIVDINPISIILNKNMSVVFNAITSIAGIISFFRWYKAYFPLIESRFINPRYIKVSSN
jgi:hypothetical protein